MLAKQTQHQIPTIQTYKELDQSKNIIKEALLSNPALINNIMINLEESHKNQETTQVAQHNPMEIFQQSESNEIPSKNRNGFQEVIDQNDPKQAQDFEFQQEQQNSPKEQEKQTKTQKAVNKFKKLTQQLVDAENIDLKKIEKKSIKKAPKAEISNKQAIKAKRSNDSKKYQMDCQNDKKTTPNKQKIKQCNFQIVIKQDKRILQLINKKTKKNEEQIQQEQPQPISFRIEISLLKDDKSNQRITQDKPLSSYHKRPKNNFEKQKSDIIEDQDQQSYNQQYYDNQNEQVQNYSTNNKSKTTEKINLGNLSLQQIVKILYNQKLISQSLYDVFRSNHTIHDFDEFIKKFTAGKLATFDYKNIPFTLLDHRRLAELIFNLYPDKYYIGEIYSENVEVFNFLVSCYDLQSEMYYKLYKNIDQLSKVEWWKQLILNNKKRIDEAFKLKNAYRNKNSKEKELQRKKFDEQLKEKTKFGKKGTKRL